MGNAHLIYQQTEQVQVGALQNNDSLATNINLRTPIQQAEVKEPMHLRVQQQYAPKKETYRKWSENDSIYFNLKKAESGHELLSIDYKGNELVQEKSIEQPVTSSQTDLKDTTEQILKPTVAIPPPPVNARKSSAFEGSKDWLSAFIILALVIAGFVKLSAGKYLSDLFSSIRYQQSASKLFSSVNVQNQKPAWALTILFFLSTSLLIFEFAHVGGKTPELLSPFVFFLLVIAGIIVYFLLKNILYRLVAYVFDTETPTKEYLFNANMLSKVFGMASLPIVCIVPFVDALTATFLVKSGLALFVIMYMIQLLRGAKIILHSPLSIFYMFLYFCALEILPLSILIKVMIY